MYILHVLTRGLSPKLCCPPPTVGQVKQPAFNLWRCQRPFQQTSHSRTPAEEAMIDEVTMAIGLSAPPSVTARRVSDSNAGVIGC